jgi:hypothetical protein
MMKNYMSSPVHPTARTNARAFHKHGFISHYCQNSMKMIHLFRSVCGVCVGILFCPSALAFDTGYHFDLTRDVLFLENFNDTPITYVQIFNYYNDGYESAKKTIATLHEKELIWGGMEFDTEAMIWDAIWAEENRNLSDEQMHFDDLVGYADFTNRWNKLLRNTYDAVQTAESKNDVRGFLAILGMTSHQVQDFYAHSNWADKNWGGLATWFDVPDSERSKTNLYGYGAPGFSHGTPTTPGINKDYASRSNFKPAYREAFLCTWQWFYLLKSWVSSSFWTAAATYNVDAGQKQERDFCEAISLYGDVGHYKGPTSGSDLDVYFVGWDYIDSHWSSTSPTQYPGEVRNMELHDKWREYQWLVAPDRGLVIHPPMTIMYPPKCKWLDLTFQLAAQTDNDVIWNIDTDLGLYPDEADFYPRITFNGHQYNQAFKSDSDWYYPGYWLAMYPDFSTNGLIPCEIGLYDNDGWWGFSGDDDHCDTNVEYDHKNWINELTGTQYNGLGAVHVDGFVYDAGFWDADGDGDEAQLIFQFSYLDEPRYPKQGYQVDYGAEATVPGQPIVSDDGKWSGDPNLIHFSWAMPVSQAVLANPVLSFQYQLIWYPEGSTNAHFSIPLWTSCGLATEVDIPKTIEHGTKYVLNVKAQNAIGWSQTGSSDGIVADLEAPTNLTISTFQMVTHTNAIGKPTQTNIYLNIGLSAEDPDSGLLYYYVFISRTGEAGGMVRTNTTEVLFSDKIKASPFRSGPIQFTNFTTLRPEDFCYIAVQAIDAAGRTSAPVTASLNAPPDVKGPDLTVTEVTAPNVVTSGGNIAVQWKVRNQGDSIDALAWLDYVYFSANNTVGKGDVLLGKQRQIASPTTQSNYTANLLARIPSVPAGTYYLIVQTDAQGVVREAEENNNQRVISINVLASEPQIQGPDLKVIGVAAPSTGVAARSLLVQWNVLNRGDGTASPGWYDTVYFSTNNTYETGDLALSQPFHVGDLPAGSNYTASATVGLPPVAAGTYYLILRTDSLGGVFEADEGNNQIAIPITVLIPDLTVAEARSLTEPVAGQNVTVIWTVLNQGTGKASPGWYDAVYLSTNNTYEPGDMVLIQPYHAGDLAPGSNYITTARVTIPESVKGTFYLIVRTDSLSGVFEANETNNQRVFEWSAPEEPPKLSISLGGRVAELSWPVAAAGFTLESTTQLGAGTWETVTNKVLVVEKRQVCTVACTPACRFYRLRKD